MLIIGTIYVIRVKTNRIKFDVIGVVTNVHGIDSNKKKSWLEATETVLVNSFLYRDLSRSTLCINLGKRKEVYMAKSLLNITDDKQLLSVTCISKEAYTVLENPRLV